MTQYVGYWYNAQIRTLILHTQRLLSNFYVSSGSDSEGNPELTRVPCIFMSTDRVTVNMINNNTDTILETVPKMVLTISELKLNNDKISGAPYYDYESDFNEKSWNEEKGEYEYDIGNSYHIKRLNPLPIGITFKLYILTTMQTHKFQLFEQIRMLFSPTAELQTSENPLDWSRVTALTLTGVNYSSKGTSSLDSTTLDAMDLTFEVDTNLDAPSLLLHNQQVETIVTEIGDGKYVDDLYSWGEGDSFREYHTPTENSIIVKNNNEILLVPSSNIKDWYQLLKFYGFRYTPGKENIYLHCLLLAEDNSKRAISGPITINPIDPTIASCHFNLESMPTENIKPVDAIVDPHKYKPNNKEGERYILDESIGSDTAFWGILKDLKGNILSSIKENCIIEYIDGFWRLSLDPMTQIGNYYVRDLSDAQYLYTFNDTYNIWYDLLNRKFRPQNWRISKI